MSKLATPTPMREITGLDPVALPDEVLRSTQPLVLRGLVAQWPMVKAAQHSARAGADYILRFYRGMPVVTKLAASGSGGWFFYNEDLSGFNFKNVQGKLDDVLAAILKHVGDPAPPAIYVGSTTIDACLPGFRAENDLTLDGRQPLVSIWMGNRSRVSAHYDVPDNMACVVAGRRRFTLFPPEQVANLYIGPLDLHPAGQAISLVDFSAPDLQRFPKFADALESAQVAELAAGDAIFIPGLWWHHIEALDDFNVLVNYWWRQAPEFLGPPIAALILAMLSLRDLPAEQRAAWHAHFRHYVFEADETTAAHIPEAARSVLSPLDAKSANALYEQLMQRLKR